MNKAFLEEHPNMAEEYREKVVHKVATDDPLLVPICGASEHMWSSTEDQFIDCPDCMKKMGKGKG